MSTSIAAMSLSVIEDKESSLEQRFPRKIGALEKSVGEKKTVNRKSFADSWLSNMTDSVTLSGLDSLTNNGKLTVNYVRLIIHWLHWLQKCPLHKISTNFSSQISSGASGEDSYEDALPQAITSQSIRGQKLIKLVYFSYANLHELLTGAAMEGAAEDQPTQYINSRLISASVNGEKINNQALIFILKYIIHITILS